MTKDNKGKVTNSQLDTTNESQEVSPFPAGDHKAHINRRAQRHSKHKTEKNRKNKQICPVFRGRSITVPKKGQIQYFWKGGSYVQKCGVSLCWFYLIVLKYPMKMK